MITCKECKWWENSSAYLEHNRSGYHRPCFNNKLYSQTFGPDEAGVDDGYGRIETGPNFGCIHGELASEAIKP